MKVHHCTQPVKNRTVPAPMPNCEVPSLMSGVHSTRPGSAAIAKSSRIGRFVPPRRFRNLRHIPRIASVFRMADRLQRCLDQGRSLISADPQNDMYKASRKSFVVGGAVLVTLFWVSAGCRSPEKSTAQSDSISVLSNKSAPAADGPPSAASLYLADTVALPSEFVTLAAEMEKSTNRVWKVNDKEFPWVENLPANQGGFDVRVRILYGLFRDGDQVWQGQGTLYCAVIVDASRKRQGTIPEKARVELRLEEPFSATQPLHEALVTLVEKTQTKARASLITILRVQRGTDRVVLDALMSDEDSVAAAAALEVRTRKLTDAIPILEKWLPDVETEKLLLAVQTLGALREEAALKPLSTLVGHHDPDLVREVVWAIAEIGGAKAKQYLNDIAEGHAYPTVREQARSLLNEH